MLLGIRISLFLIKLLKRIQNSSLIKRIRIPFIPLDLSKLKVAFIMDGNRRYAKSVNKTNPKELGLISMKETINFCHKLKIKELNFYVLSIKNLQRPESEISEINSLLSKKEYFNFKLKVIGNLMLLKKEHRKTIKGFVSENNKRVKNKELTVNLFICYDESIYYNKDVDLIIRTSNVHRLSGFLVRQAARGTKIHFLKCMWPEFTYTHFILSYMIYGLEVFVLENCKKI